MIPTLTAFDAFLKKLSYHDWYYSFSDDGSVYRSGLAAEKALDAVANTNEFFKAAHTAYCEYIRDNIRGKEMETILRNRRDIALNALRDKLVEHFNDSVART